MLPSVANTLPVRSRFTLQCLRRALAKMLSNFAVCSLSTRQSLNTRQASWAAACDQQIPLAEVCKYLQCAFVARGRCSIVTSLGTLSGVCAFDCSAMHPGVPAVGLGFQHYAIVSLFKSIEVAVLSKLD